MAETMKRIVLARRPKGEPVLDDFRLEEDAVPPCPADGILVRVLWQSLDPYMRGRLDESKSYAKAVPVGGTMEAGCVAEVVESRHDRFRAGDIVEGRFGWCTHAASDGDEKEAMGAVVSTTNSRSSMTAWPPWLPRGSSWACPCTFSVCGWRGW